jgi:alginate O-acetyltransferase complex protein AlgI
MKLVYSFILGVILQVSVISVPSLAVIFKTANLNFTQWLIVALLFCAPLAPAIWKSLLGAMRKESGIELVGWGQTFINIFVLLVCTALLVGQSYNPFLYFRF